MKNIILTFKEVCQNNPDKIAIEHGSKKISYLELDILSNKFANYFTNCGIKGSDIVPIIMTPDINLIATILGLFKIGAAYLPLSTKSTQTQILKSLNLLKSRYIVSNELISIENINTLNIQDGLSESDILIDNFNPGEIAYMMFTSGSTGDPKGVVVTHSNLYNLLENMQKYYPVSHSDKYLLSTSYIFDVSIIEILGWIQGGGSLVIGEEITSKSFFKNIGDILAEKNVTHVAFVPSVIESFIDKISKNNLNKINQHLKHILLAGEMLSADLVRRLHSIFNKVEISNLYGPTETTVYTTFYKIERPYKGDHVPIGKEFDNNKIILVGENGDEVGTEQIGEIYIGGSGVSKGYFSSAKLNNEKFCYINQKFFYKSGDFGMRLNDGNIKILGRKDDQVKINGIRIELGEIESKIINHVTNIQAIRVLYNDNKLFCVYVSAEDIKSDDIKEKLKKHLPTYLLPNVFVKVDTLPLTENGKIDKKLLLKIIESKPNINKNSFTNLERDIIDIFNYVLNQDDTNINTNFFEYGGDSLSALNATIELEDKFKVSLDDYFVYQYPTPADISLYLNNYFKSNVHNSKIETSNQIVERIYYNNNILGELIQSYKTHYLQNVYHHYQYQSVIPFRINISKNISKRRIEEVINQIIDDNPLLRSTLIKGDSTLVFNEYKRLNSYILPQVNESKSEKSIEEMFVFDFYKNPYNRLLYSFVLNENENEKVLLGYFSPYIADKSTNLVFMQAFSSYMNNKEIIKNKDTWSYKKFIENSDNVNKIEYVKTHPHTQLLKLIKKPILPELEQDGLLIIKTPMPKHLSLTDLINYSDYYSTQIVSGSANQDRVSYSTIFDRRKLQPKEFKELMGDLHMSVVSYGVKGEEFKDFQDRVLQFEADYKKGFNSMSAIYKTIPDLNADQNDLYNTYVENVLLKTNFIGSIKKGDLNNKILELDKIKQELKGFPGKRLYVTSFSCEGELFLGFLSYFKIPKSIKEKYEISMVKEYNPIKQLMH